MTELKIDFEAVFVDHGGDWPETYEYVEYFKSKYPLTILKPKEGNIYDYCWDHEMVPAMHPRWCTRIFKIKVIHDYYEKPCFQYVGIDSGEAKRARISTNKGVENRYLLIEHEIDRQGCKDLIKKHGLKIPMKSGCYICPFQRRSQWKGLRIKHPELFCKTEQLEKRNMDYRVRNGKKKMFLSGSRKNLRSIVNEDQMNLFPEDDYPPCQCGL